MRKAITYIHGVQAGFLIVNDKNNFSFLYEEQYNGEPVSLTMPTSQKSCFFDNFPPFFEGLLHKGIM